MRARLGPGRRESTPPLVFAADLLEHAHDLLVRAAVQRAREGADRGGDSVVHVGQCRDGHAGGECRGVVLMVRVQNQRDVERVYRVKLYVRFPGRSIMYRSSAACSARWARLDHLQTPRKGWKVATMVGILGGQSNRLASVGRLDRVVTPVWIFVDPSSMSRPSCGSMSRGFAAWG